MARTTTGQDSPRVALATIEDLVKTSGRRGDALRGDGLAGLAAVKRAKLVQTRRERARIAVRHGEDSDRVARLDRQLAIEHRFLVNTRAEADRVTTPMLVRDNAAWQVHGYLRSQDGLARGQYGVALVADVNGRKTLAETATDKRGYFLIRLEIKAEPPATTGARAGSEPSEEEDAAEEKRAAESDRMARLFVRALGERVFLGVTVPGQSGLIIDERALYPMAGSIVYRDLTVANPKDDGQACQLKTRLLGNSGPRELHDLGNEKPACQIAEIRPDRRVYFQTTAQAEKLGYDFCAYCFGRQRSKR
jgi:hypothetical protein